MPWILPGIILSYLIGSLPTAYVFGRLLKGIDIRRHGSGNVGATNALRVLGKGPGALVLLIDVFKGLATILLLTGPLARRMPQIDPVLLMIALGISCICGHNWTVFLNFRGGKGIATTLGVLIGFATQIEGLYLVILVLLSGWLILFLLTRIVSLASMVCAVLLPLCMLFFDQPRLLVYTSVLLSCFVLYRHKANLKRLLEGKEQKISFKK